MTTRRVSLAVALLCASVVATAEEPASGPKLRLGPSEALNEPGKATVSSEAQKLSNRALAAFQKGDLGSARKDFQQVLKLAPNNLATTINLGLLEYREKHYAEAEQLLEKAVETAPKAGLAWLILGVIRYDQEKLDGALAALAQSVYFEPKDARAHHYLGVTIGRKGWYLGAEAQMRLALELQPDYAEVHFNLAVFYLQRVPPSVELARRHYQRAVDLGASADPDIEKKLSKPVN